MLIYDDQSLADAVNQILDLSTVHVAASSQKNLHAISKFHQPVIAEKQIKQSPIQLDTSSVWLSNLKADTAKILLIP